MNSIKERGEDKNESTVLVDLYRRSAESNMEGMDSYKGLKIHALPGLHAKVESLLNELELVKEGLKVIELGSGAMTLRYHDMGFRVTAVDYVKENFKISGDNIDFIRCDCNNKFSEEFKYPVDIVSAIEIIEHIENPRNFLRECVKLLKKDGILVLTTPNIDSTKSKLDFIIEGTFNMFRDTSYSSSGHITPISSWQLFKIIQENKLKVVAHTTFGNQDYKIINRPKAAVLQRLLKAMIKTPSYGDGVIHILILKTQ